MRIGHNIGALNTYRQLTINGANTNKSLEKLSSGLRINRAGDDAAGLAISEKMRGQIRGLDQASRNAQDSISLIQTAEGALNETHSILQRMRELAVQSSNDTNTIDDRNEIQKEIEQLKSEVNRISSDTEFNTKKLLNGNIGITSQITTPGATKVTSVDVVDAGIKSGTYTVEIDVTTPAAVANGVDGGTSISVGTDVSVVTAASASFGSYRAEITEDANNAGKYKLELFDAATGESVGSNNNLAIDTGGDTTIIAGISFDLSAADKTGTFTFDVAGDFDIAIKDAAGNTVGSSSETGYAKSNIEIAGLKVNFKADLADGTDTEVTILSNAIQYHIGANEGQTMKMAVSDMSAKALGVDKVDVTSAAGAETAITSINDAIKLVSAERSKLGAVQNRLEHTINNLGTSAENLTSSESRIRDVDMAKEMMEFTKNNILQQAAQSMLAQANQQPQGVLQLLR